MSDKYADQDAARERDLDRETAAAEMAREDMYEWETARPHLGNVCACVVDDDPDDGEPGGWRPCPEEMCDRPDHAHSR